MKGAPNETRILNTEMSNLNPQLSQAQVCLVGTLVTVIVSVYMSRDEISYVSDSSIIGFMLSSFQTLRRRPSNRVFWDGIFPLCNLVYGSRGLTVEVDLLNHEPEECIGVMKSYIHRYTRQ